MAGATPLLLDIDPDTYTMDAEELAAVLQDPPPGLPPIRAATGWEPLVGLDEGLARSLEWYRSRLADYT